MLVRICTDPFSDGCEGIDSFIRYERGLDNKTPIRDFCNNSIPPFIEMEMDAVPQVGDRISVYFDRREVRFEMTGTVEVRDFSFYPDDNSETEYIWIGLTDMRITRFDRNPNW